MINFQIFQSGVAMYERLTSATVRVPQLPMTSFSSPCRISRTRSTPGCPKAPSPHRNGRPTPTALAPSARALNISVPRRNPPSTKTGTRLGKIFRARAQVRFAVAASGIVYRQQRHCRTGRLNTPQQLFAGFPLAWRIELVPNRTAQCFIHLFDRRRGHRRKALQGPAGASCTCHGHLSVHVEPALTACGTQENRAVINRAEQLHTRINEGGIVQTTWP